MRLKGCCSRKSTARNPAHWRLSDLSMISLSKTDEMSLKIVTTSGAKARYRKRIQAAARWATT